MKTTVTKRAQTVVPAAIQERYHVKDGDTLERLDDGQVIKIVPIPDDPVEALRGSAREEGLLERLLASRQEDLERG